MVRAKLKNRRVSLGYTQSYVADRAGISRTFYTEIENGNRNCTISKWAKISAVLKIPVQELFPYIIENQKGA